MSLSSIISSASAALLKTQYSIGVSNTNIANASDASYTRKTYSGSYISSTLALVTGEVERAGDNYLNKSALSSATTASAAETLSAYLQSYDLALGSVDSSDDLSSLLDGFQTALTTLAASPSSTAAKTSAVSAAEDIASKLNAMSSSLQSLRTQASKDISAAINEINAALASIDKLNDQIVDAATTGADASSLEDQRGAALETLAELVGISTFTQADGRTVVYSQSGELLVGVDAATLSYAGAGALSADVSYPGAIPGVLLNGVDITASLTGGKVGSLIEIRDTVLPAEQEKLDLLASTLSETINSIANEGTASPPPNSLSSTRSVSASDALNGSGQVRIAVLDSDGAVVSSTDLDLTAFASMADMVAALDAIDGLSASISNGALTMTADAGNNGIAIGARDSSLSGVNFSAYFGFNDLFTGDDASSIAVSARLSEAPSLLPTASLSDAASLAAGAQGLTSGDSALISALAQALDADQNFSAAGGSAARTASLQSYASSFVADAATLIADAESDATQTAATRDYVQSKLSSLTGVNLDEETALLTQLQTQYEANAQLIAMAREMFDTLLTMVR